MRFFCGGWGTFIKVFNSPSVSRLKVIRLFYGLLGYSEIDDLISQRIVLEVQPTNRPFDLRTDDRRIGKFHFQ